MTDLERTIAQRQAEIARIASEFPERGVEFVQIQFPDLTGLLRTKYAPFKASASGESLNAILYNVSHADGAPVGDVVFDAPICSLENGYGSIQALIDPGSAVIHGWRPDTASVMLNSFENDGSACALDLRACLEACEARAHALGYQARFAFEYEFGIFHYDEALIGAGRFAELRPYGHSFTNYDMLRAPHYEDLIQEYLRRMTSIGAPAASFVSEYGHGMYEFALKPLPALAAADAAVRAKQHMKELCLERGLIATFMTRFQSVGGESASGLHIHQCLLDSESGANAFYDPVEPVSPVARQYAAGLLKAMRDTHLVFRPTMNAYRRMDRNAWSPEEVYWGIENRVAPLRAINRPAADACRIEHRCAGSDANPYLCVIAMLGAGLKGIEERWEPGELVSGESLSAQQSMPLPRRFEESIELFEDAALAQEIFGEPLWRQYLLSRRNELEAYRAWQDAHITDFEYARYFLGV